MKSATSVNLKTPRACAEDLKKVLPAEDLAAIKEMPRDDLSILHFGLGLFVRNHYIHGKKALMATLKRKKINAHEDALSSLIIKILWLSLHQVNCDLLQLTALLEGHSLSWQGELSVSQLRDLFGWE